MEKIKLSICIPTYEMRGEAKRVLTRSFDILKKQTFKDFEVVVSDNSEEEIIKILYMDDYLANENSLQRIVENFKGYWLVTGCEHDDNKHRYNPHYPKYNKKIYYGKNTLGSPSVLAIKNGNPLLFDENMTWLLDCDYYKRMHDKYGEPNILNEVNVIIGISEHQVTNILSNFVKKKEYLYMLKKYKKELFYWLKLW